MDRRPILIVEDEPELGKVLTQNLSQDGYAVHLAETAEKALILYNQKPFDVVISDIRLPDMDGLELLDSLRRHSLPPPVILMTGFGTVQNAVEAMRKGAFDYLLKPFPLEILEQEIEKAMRQRTAPKLAAQGDLPHPASSHPIVTQDKRMNDLLDLCARIAPSKATVLIQGESGTGKELLARYIHLRSERSHGPFVAVNCASLPETLLESELFGHEKGAFTGAIARKIGKFELAHRGTILLDEISEMNTFLQAKILRVLQENELDRIGGSRPIQIDIRVVATTNRDLEATVKKGDFREDLYYRLNVINLTLPPLRERPGDVELLTRYFLKIFGEDSGRDTSISEPALGWLKRQEWRGNVRELRNTLERAVLLSPGPLLEIKDFSPPQETVPEPAERVESGSSSLSLKDMEQRLISRALEKTRGNRTHAARILGISIRTLRNKLNEYKGEVSPGEIP